MKRRPELLDRLSIQLLLLLCGTTSTYAQKDTCRYNGTRLMENSSSVTLSCGKSLSITCNTQYDDFQWYRLSEERFHSVESNEQYLSTFIVHNDDIIKTLPREKVLFLISVRKNDIGWYLATGRMKDEKRVIVQRIYLNITCDDHNEDQQVIEEIQNGTAPPYFAYKSCDLRQWPHDIIFFCHIRGYPPPTTITWLKNNNIFKEKIPHKYANVEDFGASESGNYTNIGCNSNGCVYQTFHVQITENMPTILNGTANITVQVGQSVNLTCTIFSDTFPYATQWSSEATLFKNSTIPGFRRPSIPIYFQEIWHYTSTKYMIFELKNITRDHQGSYSCKGSNKNGDVEYTMYLTVVDRESSYLSRKR